MGILRDGAIEPVEAVKDGDYLVFQAASGGEIVVMQRSLPWRYLLAAAGVAVMAAGWQMTRKKGKKQEQKEQKTREPG